jgi:hypothetical protein
MSVKEMDAESVSNMTDVPCVDLNPTFEYITFTGQNKYDRLEVKHE